AQAVLFRTSHHSAQLEIELIRCNIPFVKYGGLKFLETAHVKDVLSLLRWSEYLHDRVAGFRVLQLMPGIGPSTAALRMRRHRHRRRDHHDYASVQSALYAFLDRALGELGDA